VKTLFETALNAVSDATSQNSAAIDAQGLFRISCQAVFSDSTAAGSVKLQGSNDPSTANNLPGLQTPTHWSDIPNTSQTVTAGATVLVPATEISYRFVRVVFIQTTPGVGTITANVVALGY
jgi:hypothetical protein